MNKKIKKMGLPYINDLSVIGIYGHNTEAFKDWDVSDGILVLDMLSNPFNHIHVGSNYEVLPNTLIEFKFIDRDDISISKDNSVMAYNQFTPTHLDKLGSSIFINYNITDTTVLNVTIEDKRSEEKHVECFRYNLSDIIINNNISLSLDKTSSDLQIVLLFNVNKLEVKPLYISSLCNTSINFVEYFPIASDMIFLPYHTSNKLIRFIPKEDMDIVDMREWLRKIFRNTVYSNVSAISLLNNNFVSTSKGPIQVRKLISFFEKETNKSAQANSITPVIPTYNKPGTLPPPLLDDYYRYPSNPDFEAHDKLMKALAYAGESSSKIIDNFGVNVHKYQSDTSGTIYVSETFYDGYSFYGVGYNEDSSKSNLKGNIKNYLIMELINGRVMDLYPSEEEDEEY